MAAAPMRKVTLRNIAGHKLRLLLSVLAVLLGTAFVTGSFVFTATLQGTFDSIVEEGTEGIDAQVSAAGDVMDANVPLSLVDQISDVEGVERVEPQISGTVVLMQGDGDPYQTGGAPTEGMVWQEPGETIGETLEIVEGRAPAAAGETALPADVAERAGLALGEPVEVYTTNEGIVETDLVGLYSSGTDSLGYVGVAFSQQQARALFTDGENVSTIAVQAAEGVDQETLAEELRAVLPEYEVQTGEQVREEMQDQIGVMLDFVNYFFVAFGLVALLVGTFIIYNTFSMLVAQRLRELALLRAIGASRRQITRSVLTEAGLTGIIGSAVGVLAGFGLAAGIFAVLEALDQPLPTEGMEITATAVVVPLVLGLGVTMLSAWAPALRAGRVPPVDAMRQGASAEPSVAVRTLTGFFAVVAGIMLAVIGTWNDSTGDGAITVGVGTFLLILGAFLVLPALARPIAGGIGRVIGLPFRSVGRLAATNAGRNSRRTAATAFALTLGLTLVAAFGTIGASTRDSIAESVDIGVQGDLIIQGTTMQGPPMPLPGDVGDQLREIDEVDDVLTAGFGYGQLGGETMPISGVTGSPSSMLDIDVNEGSLDPAEDSLVVSQATARSNGWVMGTELTLMTPVGEEIGLTVTGVYEQEEILGPFYVGGDVLERIVPEHMRQTQIALVDGAPGVGLEELREVVTSELADIPVATVQDRDEFTEQMAGAVDQLLTIIYALLGLALVIAVLGIVNTLALSVIERRTEIGMLRAVGMQRKQLRRMITLESVQIAIFGAAIGAVMGVFLGWAFVTVLSGQGLLVMTIPWSTIGIVLVSSAVVGVIAAIWPAQRAAKISPLEAIAE